MAFETSSKLFNWIRSFFHYLLAFSSISFVCHCGWSRLRSYKMVFHIYLHIIMYARRAFEEKWAKSPFLNALILYPPARSYTHEPTLLWNRHWNDVVRFFLKIKCIHFSLRLSCLLIDLPTMMKKNAYDMRVVVCSVKQIHRSIDWSELHIFLQHIRFKFYAKGITPFATAMRLRVVSLLRWKKNPVKNQSGCSFIARILDDECVILCFFFLFSNESCIEAALSNANWLIPCRYDIGTF